MSTAASSPKVWSKGDKCLAFYEEDGKFYPGQILKIFRSPDLKVTVQFDGYNKEEAETLDISNIKPISKKPKAKQDDDVIIVTEDLNRSLFKPLCGKEGNRYLEDKYKDLSDEDDTENSSSSSILHTPQRKGVVATGGQSKQKKVVKKKKPSTKDVEKEKIKKVKTSGPRSQNKTDSSYIELSQDTFDSQQPSTSKAAISHVKKYHDSPVTYDSQKPSTSKTALKHSKKPAHYSDSSDDSFEEIVRKLNARTLYDMEIKKGKGKSTSEAKTDEKRLNITLSSTESTDSDFKNEGFGDSDLEKPRFKFTPCAGKVPYKLTEPDEKPVIQVPATINRYLRDYQRQGIQFMFDHYKKGQGCILGDDMGLGKTVQVIGFLAALLRKHGNRLDILKQKPKFIREMSDIKTELEHEDTTPTDPFLIIGPGSVLYNWMDELETWGYFTVGKFHGTDKDQCYNDINKGKYEVIVTTFETFRDNQERLNEIKWSAVIVDEVHKIKGQQAQITQALKSLKTNLRYGLTGTALQNDMLELWCILDWAQPNCLGEVEEFRFDYVEPIKQGQKMDATKRQLAEARKLKEKFSAFRNKMLLRRTKKLIADQLPTKDDNVVYCCLTPFQESVYKCLLDHPLMRTVMRMDQPCDCGSDIITGLCCNKLKEFKVSFREVMFTFLSLFMKVGNHVALLVPTSPGEDNLKPLTKHILKSIYDRFPQYFTDSKEASFRTLSDPKYCGKMKVLKGLLSVFSKDHSKVLIFSYSTRVLDIFEQYLMTTEHEYRRIDGSTNMKKRMDLVREFNQDPNIFIFLISTKAGGLGLNLTGANRVVIFDPNWNPTHDLQAQDRAYRIGQRRNVKVYRLISAGTIEENMYLRQIYKQQLDSVVIGNQNANRYFKGIAGDRAHQGELFGVKNMFQFRPGNQCLTLDIINENERVETELAGFTMSKYISSTTLEEKTDTSEQSESDITEEDEVDGMSGDTENSLLEMFGISDKDDYGLNNNAVNTSDSDCIIEIASNQSPSPKKQKGKQEKQHVQRSKRSPVSKTPRKQTKASSTSESRKLIKKKSESFSSVSDVFDECGVVHIHENRQLIGGSKAEDHMTKCAIQDVYELHQNSQKQAIHCEPMSESDDSIINEPVKSTRGRKTSKPDHNTPKSLVIGSNRVLVGQTPKAIRLKHFEEMVGHFKKDSAVDLAEQILSGSVRSRMNLLEQFYTKDKPELKQVFPAIEDEVKDTAPKPAKNTTSHRKKKNLTSGVKKTRKRKENETLGISFLDVEDSESQTQVTLSKNDSIKNKTQSLEVGMPSPSKCLRKPSPKKLTRIKPKTRNQRGNQERGNETTSMLDWQDCSEENGASADSVDISDDVEKLIHKIGHQEDVKVQRDEEKELNMSVLDDIFSSSHSKTKRKKAPQRTKKTKQFDTSDLDSLTETSVTEDDEANFADISTLKDDGIDVFSDPVKWKTRKRHRKDRISLVDQMVSDANDDYDDLFKSGKMKKVKKSKESPKTEQKSDSDKGSGFDPSASLF